MRFPSLVESVLIWREPQWRARELELERAGKLPHQRASGGRRARANTLANRMLDQVATLRAEGMAIAEIAKKLGCARDTVHRAMDKAAVATGTRAKNFSHGTTTGYAQGCRCQPCREAKAKSQQRYEQRKKEKVARPVDVPEQLTLEMLEVRRAARDSAAVREVLG